MVICKEIDDYIKYAEVHPKWINKKRKLLIKNIVKPTLKRNDVFFDEKTYRNCLQYCKSNFYELFPFQKFIYAFAFMYKDDIPVFSKFFIKEGRGNGKDGFIVPLVNFFQTPLYGVKNYHVEIVANSEGQVKDTFKVAYDMLHDNPKFKGKFSVTKELITNLATGSEMKYNTSNAKTKDGKRTGCLVLNEIHAYENYDQINVFESSFGKVKHSREFIITTDGYAKNIPDIPAAVRKEKTVDIPGMDGTLILLEGGYESTEIKVDFNFIGDSDRWDERFGLAKKWLSKRGGLLRFGCDPEHYYKILKVEVDDGKRTTERVGNFTATFLTKDGLRYLESGLGEMPASDVVDNPYEIAYPIYKITGEGECTLVVNDGKMVANIGQNLTIDTGRKLAYREDGTLSNTSVTGDYDNLILIEGRNKIEITDGFELKVIPNWRRL